VVAGVVAGVAVVGGVVVIALIRAGGGSSERSFEAALAQAAEADSATYAVTVEIDGDELVSLDAAVDRASERTRVELGVALPGVIGGDDVSMSIVTDGTTDSVYLDAGGLLPFVPEGWIRLDVGQLAELTGEDLGDLSTQLGVSPLETADLLANGDAVEVGPTEIDGDEVTQYQVTLDTRELLEQAPDLGGQLDALERLGGALPAELVYDVYVADGNELRRVVLQADAVGVELRTIVDIEELGGPIDIALPDDAADLGDLGGLFDGLIGELGEGLFGD
jgi:hypothetical protein